MADITRIGKCSGCGKSAVLVEEACQKCREAFGNKSGRIMQEIRNNKDFAKYIFNRLETDNARNLFIEWFGNPNIQVVK